MCATAGCSEPDPGGAAESSSGAVTSASTSGLDGSTGIAARPTESLVHFELWELTAAEDDPFAAERPDAVQCEFGYDTETGLFEVDTELCLYGSFSQHMRAGIQAGDTLEVVILHDALYAEQPATAHVGIAFGDEIAWEMEIPIPSEAAQIRESWVAPKDVLSATPVNFHLHNHGTNNYRFVDLTVSPPS